MAERIYPGHEWPPSPHCAPYMTRKQTEELLALVRAQPQKKWAAHERQLLRALRQNANGKEYPSREEST